MLMKKTFLLSATLLSSFMAFAQIEGTDITPANYKINQPGVMVPFYQIDESQTTPLLTNINVAAPPIWSSINGDAQYNDGLVLIGSGGGMTYAQWQSLMNSICYIDFGGEIGRTVGFITNECNIQDVLNDLAPNRAEEWAALSPSALYGGGAFNFFLDPNNCPTTGFIRAKFVVNIYNNDFSGGGFIANFNPIGDQNNATSRWGDQTIVQNPFPGTGLNNDVCMDENTGEWDPTRWIEVKFDFSVPEAADGISYTPYRIKMFFQGSQATKQSAMFFKEISFTHFTEGEPEYMFTPSIEPLTLTQGLAEVSGVESVSTENNAPVEYYNLQGVKVSDPENGLYIRKQGNTTSKVVVR